VADYLHSDLTGQIISAYYAVFYRLRHQRAGYNEDNLTQALAVELRARGLRVRTQVRVPRRYRGRRIGTDRVDLVVNETVPVEVKRVRSLTERHESQLRAYLLDGGWAVGLLVNFGSAQPQVRRLYEPTHDPTRQGAER
jgi:GxxExxY protein